MSNGYPPCDCGRQLVYEAEIAAPGYGQSWKCPSPECGKTYTKLGGSWMDDADLEEPIEFSEGDVR